jgi:2-polyprenyl-3-methyl-5-hydroxy-6-metoxy-1,4-benzoquinol methylase
MKDSQYMNNHAILYKQFKEKESYINIAKAQIDFLLRFFGDLSEKNIVEYGCGFGFFSNEFSKHHPKRIIGLDLSQDMLHLAKETALKNELNIEYYNHDCCESNPFGSIFDINFTSFVLTSCQTVKDLEKFIISINGSLKEEGISIGILPNIFPDNDSLRSRNNIINFVQGDSENVKQKVNFLDDNGNVLFQTEECHYSKSMYQKIFERNGFKNFKFIEFTADEIYGFDADTMRVYGVLYYAEKI